MSENQLSPNRIKIPINEGLNQIAHDLALTPLPFDRHKLNQQILNGIIQRLQQADEMEARLKELEPPAEKPEKKPTSRGRRSSKAEENAAPATE